MKEPTTPDNSDKNRFLVMLALIISGEAIFFLPFVLPRVFRPTILDVFDLTNLELGTAFSAYGVVAMVSYFFGGPMADKYSARNLMAGALVATSLGGLVMASIPSFKVLIILYAFWGLTTILLFWAALIRATREWGGPRLQGRAFGILDGGRGLAAALISTAGVVILTSLLPEEVRTASIESRTDSFRWVILFFSAFTLIIAALVWMVLPGGRVQGEATFSSGIEGVKRVFRMRTVWLQSIILLCGYVGYKITDDFSLYAQDVLGYDEIKAAGVGTLAMWMRPIVAVAAGLLADRMIASKVISISFAILIIGGLLAGSGLLQPGMLFYNLFTFVCLGIGIYSLRSLYFTIMEEGKVPFILTGTAVGVVSVVGYTPEIFVGPLMGWLIDSFPGAKGHQYLFLFLAGSSLLGLIASFVFRRVKSSVTGNPN